MKMILEPAKASFKAAGGRPPRDDFRYSFAYYSQHANSRRIPRGLGGELQEMRLHHHRPRH